MGESNWKEGGKMGRINLQRFVKACKDSAGLISIIAKRLDVTRQTVYSFLEREPAAQKYIDEAKEEILDDSPKWIVPECCREGWETCTHIPPRQRKQRTNVGL